MLYTALHHRLDFPPGQTCCVSQGVAFTRATVIRCRPAADAATMADAVLVAAELLANAAEHASGPLALELRFDSSGTGLRIEVPDASPTIPVLRRSRPHEPHGHGLRIIDRIAAAWGATPTRTGKTVWAEVRLSPPGPAAPRRQSRP